MNGWIMLLLGVFAFAWHQAFTSRACLLKNVELVVSHCRHNPTWIHDEALHWLPRNTRVTVYSKCGTPYPGSIVLPNVGLEAHTFLFHIVARYDSLAEVTLFTMDSANVNGLKHRYLKDLLANWCSSSGFYCARCPLSLSHYNMGTTLAQFALTNNLGSTMRQGVDSPTLVPARVRPFGAWFARYIGGKFPGSYCAFVAMAVSRDVIRRRPKEFYVELLGQTMDGKNVEVAHYLERAWGAIFGHPS